MFTVGVLGRVCFKTKCQDYSQINDVQVELTEKINKPGEYTGAVVYDYEIEGVKLSSVVQVSDFYFSGNHQINLYVKTSEVGSIQDLGSAEVIVGKMSELNSIVQYSVPIIKTDLKIEPTVIVGPSITAVKLKAAALATR